MKTILLVGVVMLGACAGRSDEEVRAGDRQGYMGNTQVTGRAPGTPAVTTDPDALMSSASVREVQSALADRGFSVEKSGKLDGRTTAALKNFQQREGIAATGLPDQLTLRKLDINPTQAPRKNSIEERRKMQREDPRLDEEQLDQQNR